MEASDVATQIVLDAYLIATHAIEQHQAPCIEAALLGLTQRALQGFVDAGILDRDTILIAVDDALRTTEQELPTGDPSDPRYDAI